MSQNGRALIPASAVCLLYRRYLKASARIPNATVRMLLLSQVRSEFRSKADITTVNAQRELVSKAMSDLNVLEDERLAKTLFINETGAVSCIDWEMRRTQEGIEIERKGINMLLIMVVIGAAILAEAMSTMQTPTQKYPKIANVVDAMAQRLEGSTPEEVREKRERAVLETRGMMHGRAELQDRIYRTFDRAPLHYEPQLPKFKDMISI